MMGPILVIGAGQQAAELARILISNGAQVELRAPGAGAVGNAAARIVVDELIEQLDVMILAGSSPHGVPPGLFALGARTEALEEMVSRPTRQGMAKYGNPRPYLKRKKGRS